MPLRLVVEDVVADSLRLTRLSQRAGMVIPISQSQIFNLKSQIFNSSILPVSTFLVSSALASRLDRTPLFLRFDASLG